MIRKLEELELNVIPVFFSAVISNIPSERGTAEVVKKYLMAGDQSRIDVLIMNSPFSQLVNSRETGGMDTLEDENFYLKLTNVPVLQAMSVNGNYTDYEESSQGLNKSEISIQVAWPEVDGQIITVPISSAQNNLKNLKKMEPLPDRIDHLARLAKNWAILHRTPPCKRKIAILLYQSRPDSGRIGNAAGLDVIESVYEILKRMVQEGYLIDNPPQDSKELLAEILDGVTNDLNWTPSQVVKEKAVALVTKAEYEQSFTSLPKFNQEAMIKDWGKPPGEICVEDDKIVIPGLLKGNVFIGYQPVRGWAEQVESLYHDPNVVIPHQYLEYYRWLQNEFKADVIVHMGTHGTLEWLPGKTVGLSHKCYPDLVLNAVPHVYPYIIDDPGEGIQAKRRSEAVLIGHLNPIMARAGSYDDLAVVETPLQEYFKFKSSMSSERKNTLLQQIYEETKKASLFADLKITVDPGAEGFEEYLGRLHDYLTEVKDALIRDGLHVLGRVPREHHLDEAVYSLTRLRNGDVPSLREALADSLAMNLEELLNNPSGVSDSGELNGILLDQLDDKVQAILLDLRAENYEEQHCCCRITQEYPSNNESLLKVVSYICRQLVPNLYRTADELTNLMRSFNGDYIPPGSSGAPTRGNADILPTGRNYFSIDPDSVPSRASWVTGVKMADQLIERYVEERGEYPREIGYIIWATDTMKTGGDDMAYILWLMGVRPVWSKQSGQVIDLEVIPLSELKRPRIDVTVRITGLFRDTFPNLIDMIDYAVELVTNLDESDEDNYLAANLRKDIIEGVERGLSVDEARRRSSVRVFGCPPGMYGPGINHAIESGEWKTVEDLADIYVTWGSCAYSRNFHGESMKEEFIKRFSGVEVTVKNMPDREIDVFDIDDVYGYLGGLNAFTRAYGKKDVMSVVGDNSDPGRLKIRDAAEECRYIFRSKILNPKYLEGLKEHGYRGAGELAKVTEYMVGWDATSDIIDDWMYEEAAEKFLFEEETKEWLKDENPYALMEMLNRLQEAIERGLWHAEEETVSKLKDLYLETEERLEEVTDR